VENTLTSKPRIHFFNLDILRFVAAAMVMITHGYEAFSSWVHRPSFLSSDTTYQTPNAAGIYIERLFDNFSLGVDFFFLISGFLITYLLLTEQKETGTIHVGKFYFRRILRIWPLYFFIILCTPLIIRITSMPEPIYSWTVFFGNNFQAIFLRDDYANGISLASQYPFMHFWSICVEEHFYLVWPLLLFLVPKKKLPWCFILIILGSITFRLWAYSFAVHPFEHLNWNTLSKIDTLAIGGWLAWIHFHKQLKFKLSNTVMTFFFIAFLSLLLFTDAKSYSTATEAVFKNYLYSIPFGFLLIWYLTDENAWLNFKKKNILHYFGKISFGIYIYHNILFLFVIKLLIFRFDLRSLPLFCIVYPVLVLVVSILSYEFLEKPFLKLKDKFSLIDTAR
jgi:peptidoglycan/LPS O-acetylase OafA/YrhL